MTTRTIEPPFSCPPKLNLDVRLIIWRLLYAIETPRLVEIRTSKHGECDDHQQGQCPRYSPSPSPIVVNICHEARREAQRTALKAGHILFPTTQPENSPPIYFNYAVDTLYLRKEGEYWIRDWWASAGVLNQLKQQWRPELLRVLAIELEPYDRASSNIDLYKDLKDFPNLEEVIFIITRPNDGAFELEQVRHLEYLPTSMQRQARQARRRGQNVPAPKIERCKLAVRCGRRLDFVEFKKYKRSRWL
jgi:2EXR family